MSEHNFSYEELLFIEECVGFNRIDFPIALYRFCYGLSEEKELETRKVEDFVVNFMSQYNKKVSVKF